jgi:sphingolipid delta-4 desaturase
MSYHTDRKKKILEEFPQIKKLLVPNESTKNYIIILFVAQLILAYKSTFIESNLIKLLLAYTLGNYLTHCLMILLHESGHNLISKYKIVNDIFGLICNLPLGIPVYNSFIFYHNMHHYGLNTKIDADVPTLIETKIFVGPVGKFLWLLFHPFFYVIRPVLVCEIPKISLLSIINLISILVFDLIIFLYNPQMLYFLLTCTYCSYSISPFSFHTFYEHYQVKNIISNEETFSYYSNFFNFFLFNYGHHREHHDHISAPWSSLPKIRQIAHKYYPDDLSMSMRECFKKFLFDDSIKLKNRFKVTK